MRWEIKEPGWRREWHKKFIWWPRKIQGHWVWLETAERKLHSRMYDGPAFSYYEYRLYDEPESEHCGGWY